MRVLVTLFTGFAALLTFVGAAGADVAPGSPAPIVVGHSAFTVEFPNDTNTCGFPVHETIDVRTGFRFFETTDGPFANLFNADIQFTFVAGGKTVVVRQHYTQRFPTLVPELTTSGLSVQILIAGGGLIIHDAGRFTMGFDGTISLVRGPHPVLEAGGESAAIAAVCAALTS